MRRLLFDRNVRAQDDLFRHVNGAWLAKTEIPANKASYGAFDILFDKTQADLRTIVEDAGKSASKAQGSDAQKIGDFYDSFMNEARKGVDRTIQRVRAVTQGCTSTARSPLAKTSRISPAW